MSFDTASVNKKETTFGENVSSSREVALVEVKLRRGRFYCATTVVSDTMLKANTVHKCNII